MPWIPRYGQPFGAAPPLAFHGRRLSRENCPHKALQSSPVSHRAGHDCSGVLIRVNSSPCLVAWLVWDCLYPFANSAAILSTSISNVQTHVQYRCTVQYCTVPGEYSTVVQYSTLPQYSKVYRVPSHPIFYNLDYFNLNYSTVY